MWYVRRQHEKCNETSKSKLNRMTRLRVNRFQSAKTCRKNVFQLEHFLKKIDPLFLYKLMDSEEAISILCGNVQKVENPKKIKY